LFGPLKHHLPDEYLPDDETVEKEVIAWVPQQSKELCCWFSGASLPQCTGRLY
jgi:hypothetical protein